MARRLAECVISGGAGPLFESCRQLSEQEIVRVCLLWAANGKHCHVIPYAQGLVPCRALYSVLCKIPHACSGCNLTLRHDPVMSGRGYLLALKDIEPGDELTLNLLSGTTNTVAPAPCRQRHLMHFHCMACSCLACTTGLDRFRGFPCPTCGRSLRDGITGHLVFNDFVELNHRIVYCNLAKLRAGDMQPLECSSCGGSFPDGIPASKAHYGDVGLAALMLFGDHEEHLYDQLMKVENNAKLCSEHPAEFLRVADAGAKDARGLLGPLHGTTHAWGLLQAAAHAAKIKGDIGAAVRKAASRGTQHLPMAFLDEKGIESSLEIIRRNCLRTWKWLEQHARASRAATHCQVQLASESQLAQ